MPSIIVGHRGVAGTYPENTRVSVQAAINLGLSWVEVDVQPTKDNVLVVCHDHTIDRCSNGKGRIDEYTLTEIKLLEFGELQQTEIKFQFAVTLSEGLLVQNALG